MKSLKCDNCQADITDFLSETLAICPYCKSRLVFNHSEIEGIEFHQKLYEDEVNKIKVKYGIEGIKDFDKDNSISPLIKTLPLLQKRIIQMRFGNGKNPLDYFEISKLLRISKNEVQKLETQALQNLHNKYYP